MKPAKVESLKSKVELGEMECYRFHTGNEIIELPLVADVKKISGISNHGYFSPVPTEL